MPLAINNPTQPAFPPSRSLPPPRPHPRVCPACLPSLSELSFCADIWNMCVLQWVDAESDTRLQRLRRRLVLDFGGGVGREWGGGERGGGRGRGVSTNPLEPSLPLPLIILTPSPSLFASNPPSLSLEPSLPLPRTLPPSPSNPPSLSLPLRSLTNASMQVERLGMQSAGPNGYRPHMSLVGRV